MELLSLPLPLDPSTSRRSNKRVAATSMSVSLVWTLRS
jgi:hypothetical protein